MSIIKPIDGRAVYQIQSGQVITDLCSVAKELVENSLDAGATSIDVKFKNHGLAGIEVQDNGDGISPQNYETLALKHYTSKLSNYSDLTTLQTFGFRGEALSSLCALSVIKVTTCLAQDTPKGTRLEFEISGKLKQTSIVAAQKGTNISIENLFCNLPVRRRELERNIKREWSKLIGVLGQYACIQTGVRFSVSQQTGSGKRTIVLSTNGNQTTKENIANVFGAKMLAALTPLDLSLNVETKSSNLQAGNNKKQIRLIGHLSLPFTVEGRQIPDRQMFFLNARPCSLPQIAKTFNEVYKSFNGSHSPFIFANILLDTHLYDVNVSPDKRTILLHDQNCIIEALKSALSELIGSQSNIIPMAKQPMQKQTNYLQLKIDGITRSPHNIKDTPSQIQEHSKIKKSSKFDHEYSNTDCASSGLISHSESQSLETYKDLADHTSILKEKKNTKNLDQESEPLNNFQEDAEQRSVAAQIPDASDTIIETTSRSATIDLSSNSFANRDIFGCLDYKRRRTKNDFFGEIESSTSPKIPVKISSFTRSQSKTPSKYQAFTKTATPYSKNYTTIGSITTPCPNRTLTRDGCSLSKEIKDLQAEPDALSTAEKSINQNTHAEKTGELVVPRKIDTDESHVDEAYFSQMSQPSPGTSEFVNNHDNKNLDSFDTIESSDSSLRGEYPNIGSSAHMLDIDSDFIDEEKKKAEEEAKVQDMIQKAEKSTALLCQENLYRSNTMFKRTKKDSTLNLTQTITTDVARIKKQKQLLDRTMSFHFRKSSLEPDEALKSMRAEERLSLTISKSDFSQMRVIGQFNLGFIIVCRSKSDSTRSTNNDLFIIDQHASDEKYNFERLQATTIIQPQKLVIPKPLSLTPVEEEIVLENLPALRNNGFLVSLNLSGESPVGKRCQLLSLPLSRETAFSLSDFDELLSLLTEYPPDTIPRPSRVRKMLAMRACRSSIMIGKSLTQKQMEKVVTHLGELDKPWNCPHGRPTMRHLFDLSGCDTTTWTEPSHLGAVGGVTNWALFLAQARSVSTDTEDETSSDH